MTRILANEWRAEQEASRYPFAASATLTSDDGRVLLEGTLLDAAVYPIGGQARAYLSRVVVTHDAVTLYVGDAGDPLRCSGSFPVTDPPDAVALVDAAGRPAGLLVSDGPRLGVFASWGVGAHDFRQAAAELVATCCFPTPEPGVRGVRLDDGTVLTGDVWLVGDDGVVLRRETVTSPPLAPCGPARDYDVIRVDVVGDPLFRRRLCATGELFQTPAFVRTLTLTDGRQSLVLVPDAYGGVTLTANNALAADTALRLTPTAGGTRISVVGSGDDVGAA